MPKFTDILLAVHEAVHDLEKVKPQKKYSEPKIYTGGVPVSRWSRLKKSEREKALSRQWYVYYSYRNPETGKLERQANIKGGANWYKTKKERLEILETYQRNLSRLLRQGYSPYENNHDIHTIVSVEEAFAFGLDMKKKTIANNSFIRFKSRVKRFEKYLMEHGYSHRTITAIDKKVVINYLNHVLDTSSPRNRNNTRTDISSLFQVLEDNDIIPSNFISKINVLKAPPKRNKTYSDEKLAMIYEYLEGNDPQLLLFIKFVSYSFLRPIEVCRLRIGDINLRQKTLTVKAKNKLVKRKIIPEILIRELPDLSNYKKDHFIFAPDGQPGEWEANDDNRRDHFTKRFKAIKDYFNEKAKQDDRYFELGKDYTIYSFRHTFITRLYQQMRKELTPFETKSHLMLITGHSTMTALEKYLRDIDAELPEDYSGFL